jgi:hypothetical protein
MKRITSTLAIALSVSLLGFPSFVQPSYAQGDEFALRVEAPSPIKFTTLSKMIGTIYPVSMYTSSEVIINFADAAPIVSYTPAVNDLISLEWVKLPGPDGLSNKGIRILSGKNRGNSSFSVSVDKGGKAEIINFAVKVGPTKDRTVRVTVLPDPPVQPLKPLLDPSKVDAVAAETIKVVAANRKISELEQVIKDQDQRLATMKPINPEEDAALAAREAELTQARETIGQLTRQLEVEKATVTELKKLNAQYEITARKQEADMAELNKRLANIESQSLASANSSVDIAEQINRINNLEKESKDVRAENVKLQKLLMARPSEILKIPSGTSISLNGIQVQRRKTTALPPAPPSFGNKPNRVNTTVSAEVLPTVSTAQSKALWNVRTALARYRVPMKDGKTIGAETLLDAQEEIWFWDAGRTRQKVGMFISFLCRSEETENSKAIKQAIDQSGLSYSQLKAVAGKASTLTAAKK